ENGGGAFLLMYAFFLLVLGLPLLMSEFMMGRMTRANLVDALDQLAAENGASIYWKVFGVLAILAGFLILSSYSVVSGWSAAYFFKTGAGVYQGATLDGVKALFNSFQTNSEAMMLWHTLFMVIIVTISAQSLKKGLERIFVILVPTMAVLLVVGLFYAFYSGGMAQSVDYILYPDWSRVDAGMPLLALQRAFFTLALGLGIMVVFGSYLKQDVHIGYLSVQIIVIDLLFSVITGLAINALVFSANVQPVFDDELAFRLLPVIFGSFEYGSLFGALFYLLLTLAAITTAVAILEAVINCYRLKYQQTRLRAASQIGFAVWLLGLGTIFSYSLWSDSGFTMTLYFGDEAYRIINQAGFHDAVIFLSSHILQPLVALFVSLFVGWVIPRSVSYEALGLKNRKLYEVWNFGIRYITPALVFVVMLSMLGVVGH
ncbi:MAG: sodium-dependent transporter, partial [Gammaproteobacteria bacterium]|nr:sodium-dependent transporter [Gammaproteobacteria bacterium]